MAKTPFGRIQGKLPVIGDAIKGAINVLSGDPQNPYVYFLLVLDPTTGQLCWSSDGEKEAMRAALSEFLSQHSH